MAIRVVPFTAGREVAVKELNARLAAAGSRWEFPESCVPSWLAPAAGSPVCQEFYVAEDGEAVRGAYALQRRPVSIAGEELPAATWYLPISEGAVDAKYTLVAARLVRDALTREPLCFGLGMDGIDSPLSKLVATFGCERTLVPFFVRAERGTRVAREARFLRRRPALRFLLDVAAASGLAWLGAELAKRARRTRQPEGVTAEVVESFGTWADELWERCRGHYSFVSRRDAACLERIYPAGSPRFARLLVARAGRPIGWAVLQCTSLERNRLYGSLCVGRITDCFAAPEDAGAVIRAAADALAGQGVDLMLSNQLHPAWCAALRGNAFLRAPSNFVFAPAARLAERIRASDPAFRGVHLGRGDGDGPWGQIRRGPWAES